MPCGHANLRTVSTRPGGSAVVWCTKHQRQSSPGSADCMTGWVVSWKCAVACCPSEESQQATLPQSRHWRSDTHWSPSSRQRWQTGSSAVVDRRVAARGRRRWRRCAAADARRPRSSRRSSVGDVEHRLLDVEHRQHVGDHLGGDGAGAADLQHPLAARPRSSPAGPGRRGRWATPALAVVPSRSQAAKLRWSSRCRIRSTTPCGSSYSSSSSSVQRRLGRLLEQGGAGQRVLGRVGAGHPQPAGEPRQRHALDEQRAGHHRERDQQQHLAVLGCPRG